MILGIHIAVALISIVFTTFTAFSPSSGKLRLCYILAGATLGSGVLLVIIEPKTMVQACVSGLVYFSMVIAIISVAQRRLSKRPIPSL